MQGYLKKQLDWRTREIAEAYDELPFWSAPFGMMLFEHIPMLRTGNVLDIGPGTGFPLTVLAQRMGSGVHFTGVDPWTAAVARARHKIRALGLDNVEIIRASATGLPFATGSFDLVVSNLGLNNIEEPARAMEEAFRVLKPGGRLCITTNLVGTFKEFYEPLLEVVAGFGEESWVWAMQRHIGHRLVATQVEDLFLKAGFQLRRGFEHTFQMRYSDGTAFLNDALIVMGFLPVWKQVVPRAVHREVFGFVETQLNALAATNGDIRMSVPMLYMEAEKQIHAGVG